MTSVPPIVLSLRPSCEQNAQNLPPPQPGARAHSRSRAGGKLQVSFHPWLHSLPRCTPHVAPQPPSSPKKVRKVKKCGSQSRAFCEWSCRSAGASQRQGPAALTGGLRPLPLPLQPKTGRLPGGATTARELIGCPCPGSPQPVLPRPASCHLLAAVGRGKCQPPPFTHPIPLPSACSSRSQ